MTRSLLTLLTYLPLAVFTGLALGESKVLANARRDVPQPTITQPTIQGSAVNPATFTPWRKELVAASHLCGVRIDLLASLVGRESNWDPEAVSSSGAVGLTQLLAGTARDMGMRVDRLVDDRLDPQKNLIGGGCYLRMMLDRFGGDTHRALVAYHRGPSGGTAKKSRDYADDILASES